MENSADILWHAQFQFLPGRPLLVYYSCAKSENYALGDTELNKKFSPLYMVYFNSLLYFIILKRTCFGHLQYFECNVCNYYFDIYLCKTERNIQIIQ